MKSRKYTFSWFLVLLSFCWSMNAQQTTSSVGSATVPRLVNFSGKATDAQGRTISGIAGATLAIYKDQFEGAPLWLEIQNVRADAKGNYTVQLGATKTEGLPLDLFRSGEARWLGVTINGGTEQPRILLLSVPYALKAADAETVGGLPPSAFVLVAPPNSAASTSASGVTPSTSVSPLTLGGSGTLDFVPLWTPDGNTLGNSAVFQSGSGNTAKIGINTTTPATTLDVKGASTLRGTLSLPATGTATASKGFDSQPEDLSASAFNSSTKKAVASTFQWQAEPTGNNSTNPSARLNLLFGSGAAPSETGLNIAANGRINFASGQTLPGTGSVSSVGLSAPASDFTMSGSPVTNNGTLTLNWIQAPTSLNTANTIMKRDASGNASANVISAAVVNATNSTLNGTLTVGAGASFTNAGGPAVVASTSSANAAITGTSTGTNAVSDGVDGISNSGTASGVAGINNTFGVGVYGTGGTGVYGIAALCCGIGGDFHGFTAPFDSGEGGGDAVVATGGNGDQGTSSSSGGGGVVGQGGAGLHQDGYGGFFVGGSSSAFGDGVDGFAGSGYAGSFFGNLNVSGAIFAGTKDFKIDHPLDPANKYLLHASIESSEMMNIYTGNVVTDAHGEATVQLPDWFELLNTNFRYQLTSIGAPGPGLYVAQKVANHQFKIAGGTPNSEVSWQVTGIRQDAYAKAHPLVVEQEKEAPLRGYYIYPELYGAPPEKQVEWARHPKMMKRMKERPVPPPPAVRPAAQVKNLQASN